MIITSSGLPYPAITAELCKGCGRCVSACPKGVLLISDNVNNMGYRVAEYIGDGCTGCAICFYNCPEPFAIEVYKEGEA
ncbi:MAG: 2-oxoisovalerate ferredoxin oxidoreductase delta subunit [Candidatus Methanomethylophilaceae archaeon]|nr:2-oxoisovalerate ferredoxin oxidoreductase delta subunit [Candidatus Methanomethylophilaceae archaeon]MDI3542285.1 2-oxoisovalerate ferredoxin oxidoreductase delta subunit [Candidatus Methanomethylophilaceae archaeon]HIJ00169.1 4Fe-4S dicluster domain-containing protein [Candidatus Methanomethylophilaceae archaeon]